MDVLYYINSFLSTVLPIAASAGTAIYAYFANRSRAAAKEITDLKAEVDALERRIGKIENTLEHLPNKDMISELKLAMSELAGTVAVMGEKVTGVAHTVGLIDESLRREALSR